MGSRIKGYLGNIPRFFYWQTFDHISFGFVLAAKIILPTISVTKALHMFLDTFGLCEDQYCFDNAWAAYYRILKSFKIMEDDNRMEYDELDEDDKKWKQKQKPSRPTFL